MCVPCCARLDDLYEFLERSTKVQLILSTLYQSNGAISVVRAEHDYAIKIPPETWFPVPENLLKKEYGVPQPNCADSQEESSKSPNSFQSLSHGELVQEKASEQASLQLHESSQEFHRETEHNYFLPSPKLSENRNEISLEQEMEHNYYVRSEKMFCTDERMETSHEIELNNGFQEATLSQILDGYPWACAICKDYTLINSLRKASIN